MTVYETQEIRISVVTNLKYITGR